MTEPDFAYVGSELDLFADARNWRAYWSSMVRPHLGNRVLEIGAGIGTITRLLCSPHRCWTAVEPDAHLAQRIRDWAQESQAEGVAVVTGSIDDVPGDGTFDTVIYIDVLEHIEDDRSEVLKAFGRLAPGGRLVVLAPAHPWLYTAFDASIGHFRRYNRTMMRDLRPDQATETLSVYLDSAGIIASAGNRLLLRSATPTRAQIQLWDRRLVPVSRRLDRVLGYRVGKSLLTVWRKPQGGSER